MQIGMALITWHQGVQVQVQACRSLQGGGGGGCLDISMLVASAAECPVKSLWQGRHQRLHNKAQTRSFVAHFVLHCLKLHEQGGPLLDREIQQRLVLFHLIGGMTGWLILSTT
jgi:hypothetical protein